MTKQELIKYYEEVDRQHEAYKKALNDLHLAQNKYCEEHGLPIGTKVRVKKTGEIGVISKRAIYNIFNKYKFLIKYEIAKMKKDGTAHKSVRIGYYKKEEDLEVVEQS